MRWKLLCLILTIATLAVATHAGELLGRHSCPHCGADGDCCWEQQVVARCKLVPDVKPIKKTVYELKEVPYCSKKPSCGGCGHCAECEECRACAKYKRVLVKKEITCGEKCGTKCVVEECLEWVAVPCCKCGYHGHCSN